MQNAPLYIEKGYINDLESPLLCNNEGLVVNQIKKREILLKDKTLCPWLVMYVKKGILGTTTAGTQGVITVDIGADSEFVYETLNTPIENWILYQYKNTDYLVKNIKDIQVYFSIANTTGSEYFYVLDSNGNSNMDYRLRNPASNLTVPATSQPQIYKTPLNNSYQPRFRYLSNLINTEVGGQSLSNITRYNDKVIKDSNGAYYKVTVVRSGNDTTTSVDLTSSTIKAQMDNCWNNAIEGTQYGNNNAYKSKIETITYRIVLESLSGINTTINFSSYTGKGTLDNLYDIVCMPYGEIVEAIGTEVYQEITTSKERSLKIMNSIAAQLSSSYVLDLQVLPYCPIPALINDYYSDEGSIYIAGEYVNTLMLPFYDMNGTTDVLLVCPESNITFDIDQTVTYEEDRPENSVSVIKFVNDCTSVRLCSPNYNGLFEMNLAKNGMSIDSFNVDMTLRPQNPYIHVNPNFKFLYGQDYNDIRGLVCGGDFSLGIVNDAWVQYEIQNKNYQAIFDRQIQNMDVNNAIARQEAMWQVGAGTVQGTAMGAGAGAMAGGAYGAAAGAAVGVVTSGLGAALDLANLDKRQAEARSYAIDNFNLQLGNVRALPYSISKTSALTANNKLFPFVEIYECTDVEKEAYYNKLKYDGMSIGVIGTLDQFTNAGSYNYFKAKLIRNSAIMGSTHEVEELNNELYKGVYI